MGWDGAGGYTRQHNFSADASAGIKILAARMDQEIDDIASAIPIAWARNGQNVPTQDMPMGGRKFVNVGAPTSVSNFMRVREFVENVPIFMQDAESSSDRISVSSQYFTSVSANQAPVDGTKIIVRAKSNKSSAALYLDGHSANVQYIDGGRIASAITSGGLYEFTYSSVDTAWKIGNPDVIDSRVKYVRTAAEISAGVTPTNYQYEPGNVLRYGAVGDDSTDDTAAILKAAAAYRQLRFPGARIYRLATEIYYACSESLHAVEIVFEAGAKIRTTGASNRAFHFDGQPANTTSMALRMYNPTIIGSNSGGVGAADEAIFLDGIALFWIENPVITGTSFDKGIYIYGSQQGEIRGGYIANMDTAIHLEGAPEPPAAFGYAGSNGVEIHGMSLSAVGTQVLIENVDSAFIHHNHMISAPLGIDVDITFGLSAIRLSNNHIEGVPSGSFTAGIRIDGDPGDIVSVRIDGNMLAGEGTLLHLVTGSSFTVEANSFFGGGSSGDITYSAAVSYVRTIGNYHNGAGTFTDNSTFGIKLNNQSAGSLDFGNDLFSQRVDTNDLRTLVLATGALPAGGASQDGRTIIEDAGAGDRNLIVYAGGQRFRIDGGAAF